MSENVVVIGGGPGGLFAARLLGMRHSSWSITVYDKLGLDDTLGFGVGLSGSALAMIASVDPATREALEPYGLWFSTAEFRLPGRRVGFPGFTKGVSISRPQLRRVLVDQAEAVGVKVVVEHACDVDAVRLEADLVVGADGVFSPTRERFADAFGASRAEGRGNYLWCGAGHELPGTVFEPAVTEYGVFTAHAYPYAPGRSTLVIETDDQTLARSGLGGPEQSEERTLSYLSAVFSDLLEGRPLEGNRSEWFHFQTMRCASWVHDNIVLVGDAAATADPSLGSGTRLAMESAIVLADSLDRVEDKGVQECLRDYDRLRRPAVADFQDLSVRSQRWWDSFPLRIDMDRDRLPVAFLTRAGVVSLDAGLERSAEMIVGAVASWAQVEKTEVPRTGLSEWILSRPLVAEGLRAERRLLEPTELAGAMSGDLSILLVPTEDPWGEEAAEVVREASEGLSQGAAGVLLAGGPGRDAVLGRLGVAERLRMELGAVIGVETPAEFREDIAAALVAGRIDFAVAEAA